MGENHRCEPGTNNQFLWWVKRILFGPVDTIGTEWYCSYCGKIWLKGLDGWYISDHLGHFVSYDEFFAREG